MSTRTETGFISALYPSPFTLDGIRWRTLAHYLLWNKTGDLSVRDIPLEDLRRMEYLSDDITDNIIVQGITAKYRDNPSLASQLLLMSYQPPVKDRISTLTAYVRDNILSQGKEYDDIDTIFDNLYLLLKGQGYTNITHINKEPVTGPMSILEGPRSDYKGLQIEGLLIEDEVIDVLDDKGTVRKKSTGRKVNKRITAIVDVYLEGGYTEDRLKEVIGTSAQKKIRDDSAYFVITTLTKQNLNKFLRVATYNNMRFFSPSELYVTPSKHMLNPKIEKISKGSHIYSVLSRLDGKLPELASSDKLAKEKGLVPRDIVLVHDFSPHYRCIV